LTRSEEETKEEEEVAEYKATFLDGLRGLEEPESSYVSLIPRTVLL
jgi:hypothetical protein